MGKTRRVVETVDVTAKPEKAAKVDIKEIVLSQVGFFWLVLLIFMAVSVTESGDFFNKAITHGVFFGTLGYAVATVFDLLSLVCMIARTNASRIADKKGEWLALLGVVVCAGVSAFANVASAVQDYQASQFSGIPQWMQQASPYIGLMFPAMIVIVTLIADHIGDLNPQKSDNVVNYRAKEQKKIDLLQVRLDIEKQRAQVQKELAQLHKTVSKREQKTVVQLLEEQAWKHQQIVTDLLEEEARKHQQTVTDLQTKYDTQIVALTEQIASLTATLTASLSANNHRRQSVTTSNARSDAKPSQAPTQVATPERHTEEIPVVGESDVSSDANTEQKQPTPLFAKRGGNPTLRKVRNILKKYPDLGPTEIAKKAQISRSYASQLKDQATKEMAAVVV